ncbi:TwdlG [Drosophila busckii]|uniref:TwdlG n=1 Tax=Drosophila busckii TaxID=30019 RepID=A0A0M4EKX0_DROBS|nr:probable global transcription activator SNF2L2 [Drosophila busckii]ALC45827.1 TwdlG [Drosophila busckii]
MRAFILTCLLGLTLAAPQGYNYQTAKLPGVSIEEQQTLQMALQAPQVQQLLNSNVAYQQQAQPQAQQLPSFFPNFNHNLQQQQLQQPLQLAQQQPQFAAYQQQAGSYQQQAGAYQPHATVSKDIYVHVPPAEEEAQHYQPAPLPVAPPRKHYRIVFIKAPTPSVSKTALRVQQAPVEEKTIIYVLTKKPDPLELQTAIQEAPKQISKPEVFFIKYKTQEEAAHAQRTIQAQYDQLGGTTQVSDEGVAPVTSVIGSLDQQQHHHQSAAQSGTGTQLGLNNAIQSKYLPANLRA